MSMTLSTLHFKTPSKLIPLKNPPRVLQSNHQLPFSFSPLTRTAKPLTKLHIAHNFHGPFKNTFNGVSSKSFGFIVKAQNGSDSIYDKEKDEMEARGQSSMPERFRYLTKEAPDKPVTWPWLIGMLKISVFLLCSFWFFFFIFFVFFFCGVVKQKVIKCNMLVYSLWFIKDLKK